MARSGPTGTIEGDATEGNRAEGNRGEGSSLGEWEYRPVQLSADVSRMTAAVRLAIQAEYSGWELSRVRLYPGGVRKVVLRPRRPATMLPRR